MSALQKYYRKPVLNIKLPTQGKFIPDIDENELTVFGEVGIMPITSHNDLELKNPENLLNGEIINMLIADCTTLKTNFRYLAQADIDALMVAIKIASTGDNEEKRFICGNPKCKHENTITVNLHSLLSGIEDYEDEYVATLSSGVKIYLQPTTYGDVLRMEQEQLEESGTIKALEQSLREGDAMTEEELEEKQHEIYAQIAKIVKAMSKTAMTTIISDIIKIVTPDDEEVFDKDEIGDFISQISKEDYEVITTELGRLNDIGVKDKVPVKCVNCESEFDLTLDFNPTTFFGESS